MEGWGVAISAVSFGWAVTWGVFNGQEGLRSSGDADSYASGVWRTVSRTCARVRFTLFTEGTWAASTCIFRSF